MGGRGGQSNADYGRYISNLVDMICERPLKTPESLKLKEANFKIWIALNITHGIQGKQDSFKEYGLFRLIFGESNANKKRAKKMDCFE